MPAGCAYAIRLPFGDQTGSSPSATGVTTRVAGHTNGQDKADGSDGALGVPVGDGLLEPSIGGAAAVQRHQPGKEAFHQAVAGHQQSSKGQQRFQQTPYPGLVEQRHPRREGPEIQQDALRVVLRTGPERRPGDRDRGPGGEQGEAEESAAPGQRPRQGPGCCKRGEADKGPGHQGAHQPGVVEEAAGEEGNDRRAGDQHGRAGDGESPTHEGRTVDHPLLH